MTKTKLESLHLYKDRVDGKYYLKAVYINESEHRITKTTIPKIELNICHSSCCINSEYSSYDGSEKYTLSGINGEEFNIRKCRVDDHLEWGLIHVYEELLEEKTTKLTVAEIEEKLGYKIEIVAEKE